MQKTMIASFMVEELARAERMYGTSFASPHEGYAVMLEEMGELFDEIKKKHPDKDRMRDEVIQVGALAIKFIQSLEGWPWLSLKMSGKELKCLECRYHVLAVDERVNLGGDPCLTCEDFGNWQPEWDTCDDCGRSVRLNCGEDFFIEAKGARSKMVCEACYAREES